LAWNVFKDYLEHKGFVDLIGSRDGTRMAFKNGLFEDGDVWMAMIKARNQSPHTYNLQQPSPIQNESKLTKSVNLFMMKE